MKQTLSITTTKESLQMSPIHNMEHATLMVRVVLTQRNSKREFKH